MTQDQGAPRVGCGAVILRADGAILLGKRMKMPEAGCWGLLGGKVDWMERVTDCIEREVLEESGLRVRAAKLLCVIDHFELGINPNQHWVSPVYLCEILPGQPEPSVQEPEAVGALGWFALDALPNPLTHAMKTALPYVKALGVR